MIALMTSSRQLSAQSISATPSTTPLPGIQLPDWMRDPNTAVIALFTSEAFDGDVVLTFLNAATGERFLLDLPYVHDVGWVDAEDGVYIRLTRAPSSGADRSEGFDEYVALDTGNLVRLPRNDLRAPVNRPTAATFPVDIGDNLSYRLEADASFLPTSAGSNAYQLVANGEITVTDTRTGESLYVGDVPTSGLRQLLIQPFAQGRYLAMVYTIQRNDERFDTTRILDTDSGNPVTLDGIGEIRWSEHHSLMLYRDYYEGDAICLMNVADRSIDPDCDLLSPWESQIQDYQWSHDGQRIIFTYHAENEQSGGLCVVDVEARRSDCPVQRSVTYGSFNSSYRHHPDNTYGVYNFASRLPEEAFFDREFPRETGVCLLSEIDYTADCITDRILPENTYKSGIAFSPSGRTLALMYTGQSGTLNEGVCSVQLQSGAITCPDTSTMQGFIDVFSWSPDSRFFLVIYTGEGNFSDDKSGAGFGILDTTTGTYRDEGFVLYDSSLSQQWRPALHP